MIQRYRIPWDDCEEDDDGKYCLLSDVEKLEEQNKQLLDALSECVHELGLFDKICSVYIKNSRLIESITGKKPEEL